MSSGGGHRAPPAQGQLGLYRAPLNLFLTSTALGLTLCLLCLACYCCGRARARDRARREHVTEARADVYTLTNDCRHSSLAAMTGWGEKICIPSTKRAKLNGYSRRQALLRERIVECYDSGGALPSYRRPPTPGPPPAYDSVVSSSDKLRKFGLDDDYSEDIAKIQACDFQIPYLTRELRDILVDCHSSMTAINKLRCCRISGSCTADGINVKNCKSDEILATEYNFVNIGENDEDLQDRDDSFQNDEGCKNCNTSKVFKVYINDNAKNHAKGHGNANKQHQKLVKDLTENVEGETRQDCQLLLLEQKVLKSNCHRNDGGMFTKSKERSMLDETAKKIESQWKTLDQRNRKRGNSEPNLRGRFASDVHIDQMDCRKDHQEHCAETSLHQLFQTSIRANSSASEDESLPTYEAAMYLKTKMFKF